MKTRLLLAGLLLAPLAALAQDPEHATEVRKPTPGPGPGGAPRMAFLTHRLGNDHAEGISLLDMDGDGRADLLSGAYWYANPGPGGAEWKQHQFRTVGVHGEFVSDCGEWIVDVDHDGLPDVVTAGWITNGLMWFKNPGPAATKAGTMWQGQKIADSYDTEGGAFADIDGDGKPDVALAHYDHSGAMWVSFAGKTPAVHHVGGREQDGHGIGVADIDGDGKPDILTPYGWFGQIDAKADKWQWHGDWRLGDAGFPILGYDVNHDGKMDLIYGQGHGYGLYWLEQAGAPGHPQWIRHTIDESFSQSHALALVDLDGDGTPELVTGKRYRGHNGGDPGSYDPNVVYAYRLPMKVSAAGTTTPGATPSMAIADPASDPVFTRIALSENGTAGIGTQVIAADLDKDGDIDIAVAGKMGVHVLENLKVDTVAKAAREEAQPINRAWPLPGEGREVEQEEAPK